MVNLKFVKMERERERDQLEPSNMFGTYTVIYRLCLLIKKPNVEMNLKADVLFSSQEQEIGLRGFAK